MLGCLSSTAELEPPGPISASSWVLSLAKPGWVERGWGECGERK